MMDSKISVREFYKGKNVLLTGGSGFMGKVLVEKLLYTIPDIGNVYLLMRPKRGKTIEQRVDDILRSPMFNRIKNEKSEVLQKVIPVEGDVLTDDLGINSDSMKVLSEHVSVVFHLAATVNMNSALKHAVDMNTVGTRRVLDVARRFKNLAMFVHVSTAFCYPDFEVLDEKFHRPTMDPCDVLELCKLLDENQLALLTLSLLGPHPNTYTFTKRLAESLVNDAYSEMPCVIARPSIVGPSLIDPMPGWVDNLNGPMGLLVGAGKGVIRTMVCDASLRAHNIPVDAAINSLIALVVIESTKEKSESVPVYNLNAGNQVPTTWGEVLSLAVKYNNMYPFALPLWYPNGSITTNYTLHEIRRILFHLVPAYLVDFLFLIAGRERIMVRIQRKISLGLQLLQYFTMREWNFLSDNYDAIHSVLSKEEDELYLTYKTDADKDEYLINAIETIRKYVLKEDPAKIPLNRIYHNFLFVLDTIVKVVFWCWVVSLLAVWFEPVRSVLSCGAPVLKYLPFLGPALRDQSD